MFSVISSFFCPRLTEILSKSQNGEQVKRILNPHLRMFRSILFIIKRFCQKCDHHMNILLHVLYCCVCVAYGGTLIEHSLMAVGLPGLIRVDSQFDVSRGKDHLEF